MNKYEHLSPERPTPPPPPRPKLLLCYECQRNTWHDPNHRVGVNGPLLTCRECGEERTEK